MTSSNILIFLPFVTYRNQLILFLLSAFWGPLPHPLWTSNKYGPQVVEHYVRTHQLHGELGLGDGPRFYNHSLGKELYNAAG